MTKEDLVNKILKEWSKKLKDIKIKINQIAKELRLKMDLNLMLIILKILLMIRS